MEAVSPLGQLIEDVRADFYKRHGVPLPYAAIAKRGGNVIGRKRVFTMVSQPIKEMPSAAALEALARGLEVPYSIVLEKALLSAGYTWPTRERDEDRRIG